MVMQNWSKYSAALGSPLVSQRDTKKRHYGMTRNLEAYATLTLKKVLPVTQDGQVGFCCTLFSLHEEGNFKHVGGEGMKKPKNKVRRRKKIKKQK